MEMNSFQIIIVHASRFNRLNVYYWFKIVLILGPHLFTSSHNDIPAYLRTFV
jgi:hypothetical protein